MRSRKVVYGYIIYDKNAARSPRCCWLLARSRVQVRAVDRGGCDASVVLRNYEHLPPGDHSPDRCLWGTTGVSKFQNDSWATLSAVEIQVCKSHILWTRNAVFYNVNKCDFEAGQRPAQVS